MRPEQKSAEQPKPDSIEGLFHAMESPLLSYAWRLAGEPGAAEDIVQEAFMKLHAQFDEINDPRRWLYRTVHNLALNHRRRSEKIVRLQPRADEATGLSPEPADGQMLPDEQIAHWEGIGLVRLSLETLDERSREVVRLKFHEDLSYREIGERTGLTSGNVGYVLHHAIKSIADELAKNGILP